MKRKSRRRAQKQARQWTYYIEALKRSLDSLYEICRNERNVPACREVMLYLNKGSRDFESLIDSFAVENDYENGLKLPSVTWEIRQTGGLIEKKETETESSCSLISSDSLIDIMPYSPALISDTIKEVAKTLEHVERNDETGWYLVQNRRRRYSSDSMGSYTTQVGDSPESEVKALNVYERLAANSGTRGGKKRIVNSSSVSNIASEQRNSRKVYGTGRLLYPKSAMDLPQTRSSMAKIAYSRRILWEQHRSMLAEKMRKRHRQEQTKALLQRPSSSHSSHDGRNRVTRHSSPLRAKSAISLELESIHEANEDEPVARSEPPRDLLLSFSLDDDEEWRALTVEEESLAQEELSLKKEIEHEESTSIDAELRRQVEAEAAVLEALEKENSEPMHKRSIQNTRVNWKEALEKCTAKLQRQGIHIWNDAISKKITHFRPPGAVVQIHEKLMSPSRQRSGNNNASNMEERLQRAEILRQQLLDAKSLRVKELSKKVEHVKTKQAELLDMKRLLFQAKMETVEQNRQKTLEEIVRKAHDDDQRVLEANFLKNIEENSARMLMELKEGEAEARRQQLEEERARRTEQNAANRVAAEKRREQQNEERNRKLQLCAERRRERQLQIDAQRLEAERLRQEQSREKLEKHQKRLAAIKASQISDSQKLLSEITRKQEECAKRHEESLEVVKKRAIESAQGHCSNRSSTISTHSDELSEPSASESFKILFEAPPAMDIRDRSFLLCGSCGFRAVSDLEAVSHVVFRHVCLSSSSQESSNSLFEVCTNVKCTGPMYVRSDVKAVSCSVKKRRPKLKHKFLEMCNALSNNQPTNVGNVSSQHKLIRNLSIKSMNSFAKYMKIVDERCDSSNTEAWRLFSETDHQLLLKIAREIGIVVSKAEKENATTEIALVLLNKGAIAKLVKLLLFFNFSSKIPCCERALEVLQLLFFHSSFVSYNILHSSLYVNWMDSVATVTKELLELGTESSETDRFLKLRDSISNMLLFNSYLHSGSACHISSPVKAEELSSTCIRYLSSFGFYSNLANYCSKALYCSMDSKLFAFLLNLDSLVFFKGFSGGKDKPSTVLDSDAVKPHILTLFRMLVTVVYRWLPSFCDSTSVDSSDHTAFRKMLEIFISFFKCYGSDTLANYMKTEQPDTAVQLLHILKFFIRSSSAESDFSMENSLADFKLGMKSLSLFCSFGSTFQALCALGHENSILYILATLDLSYYSNFALQGIVAPAIIALLYRNEFNLNLFEKEVNVAFLSKFLKRIKDEKDAVRNLLSSLGETDFDVVLAYFQNSSIKSCPIQMSQSVQWNLTAVLEHCGPLVGECVPPGSVTEEFLRSFMKTSASPQFIAALALIGPPRGELLVRNLLQIPFGEQGSLSQAQINEREGWKLSVLALRALYNILSSQRIMDSVRSLPLDNWRKLLRMIPISLEVTACLSRIAEVLYRNFSLHVDYPMIHEDFAVLYTDLPESVDRSFMTAFFLWFLREDVGYLAECKSTVDPNAFVSLLKVVDTVLDSPSHGKTLKIHYNNVRFVELYVEELASNIFDNLDSDFVLKVLCPAVSIIANALIYNPFSEGSYYDTDEMNTLKTLCDMFEAIYDIDAQEILSEQDDLNEAENDRGDGQPLRPAPSKPYRRPFLSQSVKDLAFLLKRASAAELAELRTSILKALGALASKKEKYAEEMADRRLVPLVISCARITVHSPFQMQHAITTLSMMCKHRRNQELLFEVEQTPTGAIDHEKLLAELGMRAVVDATGKLKLEKL